MGKYHKLGHMSILCPNHWKKTRNMSIKENKMAVSISIDMIDTANEQK